MKKRRLFLRDGFASRIAGLCDASQPAESSLLTPEWAFGILNWHSVQDNGGLRTSMKAGQRREREFAHARADILDAAAVAFGRSGLHATTVQDIAREAGYTAASLYTYFKSKQEIVDAMLTRLTDEYIQVFEQQVPSGLSFRQRFEIVLQRHLELAEKHRSVFDSFVSDRGRDEVCTESSRSFHDNFERRLKRLAEWLGDNAKADDLGGNDPEIVASLLFGMAFGLFHRFGDHGKPGNFVDQAPILTEFFFHGVGGRPKTGARKK
jgi:AcrR family transcriptional regulator